MKMSRKILILSLTALMAVFAAIPSTFSWFDRDDTATGDVIEYSRSDLPISLKSGNISMETKLFDKATKTVGETVTNESRTYAAGNETSYETTFTNDGVNDIYLDFCFHTVKNIAGFYIGTTSPTINKKSFTSRPSVTETSTGKTRVYFESINFNYSGNTTFWNGESGKNNSEEYLNSGTIGSSFGSYSYDFNIAYYTGSSNTPKYYAMEKATNKDSYSGTARSVFYYDLPAGTSKFFFCNKYYFQTTSNHEWNKTPDITLVESGKVYYLTGSENDKKNKLYGTRNTVKVGSTNYVGKLLNLKRSYDTVTMAQLQHVDLGLTEEDYSANTISYTIDEGFSSSTISNEGVFTAKSTGSGKIKTTIISPLGDTMIAYTEVSVPTNLSQIPIIKNLRVPGTGSTGESKSVVVKWYVKNEASANATVGVLFFTI